VRLVSAPYLNVDDFIQAYRVGEWASIISLAISLITFAILLATKKDVKAVKESVRRNTAIVDCAIILNQLQQLQELLFSHQNRWERLQERFTAIAAQYVAIKAQQPNLEAEQITFMEKAIEEMNDLRSEATRLRLGKQSELNVERADGILSRHINRIQDLFAGLTKT